MPFDDVCYAKRKKRPEKVKNNQEFLHAKFIAGPTMYPINSLGFALGYPLKSKDQIEIEFTSSSFIMQDSENKLYEGLGNILIFGARYKLSFLKSGELPKNMWYSSYRTNYYLNAGFGFKLISGQVDYQEQTSDIEKQNVSFNGESIYLDIGLGYQFYFRKITLGFDFLGVFLPILGSTEHEIDSSNEDNTENELMDHINYLTLSPSLYIARASIGYSF